MLVGNLTRRKHDLAIGAIDLVAIVVNVDEFVIGADLLELGIGREKWSVSPEPYVLDGCVVALEIGSGELLLGGKVLALNFVEAISAPRELDATLDEGPLCVYFIGPHAKALEQRGVKTQPADVNQDQSSQAG